MNDIIKKICETLSDSLNIIILLAGVFELVLLCISWYKLNCSKVGFKKLSEPKTKEVKDKQEFHARTKTTTIVTKMDWDAFDKLKQKYQSTSGIYSIYSLIIQLFTLLGILGTVAGLFIAMQNWSDLSKTTEMYNGIKFALSSTILGIIFAVIFKIFDIILCSQYINYLDDEIDRFEKNYTEAKDSSPIINSNDIEDSPIE